VTSAVLAIGGIGSTPVLLGAAESLIGSVPGAAEIDAVAATAEAAASLYDDHRGSALYKKAMAREWAARVLRACLDPSGPAVPDLVAG
jgi:CO/xanthine dehydrogenase FAD-binding subunit